MKRNMKEWFQAQMEAEVKQAMPVLSFPCVQLLGVTVNELVASSELQAQGMKLIADRCPSCASVSMMDLSVEAEAFGSTIHFSDDEVPTVIGTIMEDPEDADDLEVPEVGAARTGIYIEAIRKATELITDRPVFAGVIGPYSLAGRLMGMTEIMINCYDEPEMVETTLEKCTDFLVNYCKAFKEAGANGIVIAEPAAGLLSPGLMEEFSAPYIKRIVDELQDEYFAVIYHNCGDAIDRMKPQIAGQGAMGYHFGNAVEMLPMVEAMPEDTLVMGNVDPAGTLRNGTPEMVREETLRIMNACCGHKNFIISSGCDIPPATPWENINAFFAAVEEFYKK